MHMRSCIRPCECESTVGINVAHLFGLSFPLGGPCCSGLSLTFSGPLLPQSISLLFVHGHSELFRSGFLCPSHGDPFLSLSTCLLICCSTRVRTHILSPNADFIISFLFFPMKSISGTFFSSRNCTQRLKWVKIHQEERSVVNRHSWKGYVKHMLFYSS